MCIVHTTRPDDCERVSADYVSATTALTQIAAVRRTIQVGRIGPEAAFGREIFFERGVLPKLRNVPPNVEKWGAALLALSL